MHQPKVDIGNIELLERVLERLLYLLVVIVIELQPRIEQRFSIYAPLPSQDRPPAYLSSQEERFTSNARIPDTEPNLLLVVVCGGGVDVDVPGVLEGVFDSLLDGSWGGFPGA